MKTVQHKEQKRETPGTQKKEIHETQKKETPKTVTIACFQIIKTKGDRPHNNWWHDFHKMSLEQLNLAFEAQVDANREMMSYFGQDIEHFKTSDSMELYYRDYVHPPQIYTFQSIDDKVRAIEEYERSYPGHRGVSQFDRSPYRTVDPLYVVVLLVNEEYYGHIYTWPSPSTPQIHCFVGIRARIDYPFLPPDKRLTRLAHYLLEGVRLLAVRHSATLLTVTEPLPVMKHVLTNLGFVHTPHQMKKIIDRGTLGVVTLGSITMMSNKFDQPFTVNPFTFVLVE